MWSPRWRPVTLGIVSLASTAVLAASDPPYDPSLNFRPDNVSGLDYELYEWVGSYYNGTTKFEWTPLIGETVNFTVCKNMQNQTFTTELPSILAITETAKYNIGNNPINVFLSVWSPDFNFYGVDDLPFIFDSDVWGIFSSRPVYPSDANSSSVHDNFNLTVQEAQPGTYNLSGVIIGNNAVSNLQIPTNQTTTCNAAVDTYEWSISLITIHWWDLVGFNWTYPAFGLQFDNMTANITVDGYFTGYPQSKDDGSDVDNAVHGKVRIEFAGLVDAARSDVLVQNGSSSHPELPSWLRSVGFGNNSLNIDSGTDGRRLGSPWGWTVLSIAMFSSWVLFI